jgi:hypothetical protein
MAVRGTLALLLRSISSSEPTLNYTAGATGQGAQVCDLHTPPSFAQQPAQHTRACERPQHSACNGVPPLPMRAIPSAAACCLLACMPSM